MRRTRRGSVQVVLVKNAQLREVDFHRIRSHKGEESINAVLREVVGQCTEKQTSQGAAKTERVRVPLTIGEPPCREVVWSEIVSEKPITTRQCDSVTEDSPADCVTCYIFMWSTESMIDNLSFYQPGQRPAPSTRGFASSACNPVYNSRWSMCPYSFSAASAISGSEFHSKKVSKAARLVSGMYISYEY